MLLNGTQIATVRRGHCLERLYERLTVIGRATVGSEDAYPTIDALIMEH